MLQIGICSFSFYRLLAAGKQDIFQFIADCKELGCTQLDPWNAHLSVIKSGDDVIKAGHNPEKSIHLSAADEEYIDKVNAAAKAAGLPFGTIAVDGAHIYSKDPEYRKANRARAYRWLEVAHKLGAKQVRIDAGETETLPPDIFQIIKDGYLDLIARGKDKGIEILFENHWGPTLVPENVEKLMENIPGLGLLYDTHNWKPEVKAEARKRCAKYARATHVKTLDWDAAGNEIAEDVPTAIGYLKKAGYKGAWSIESVPKDGDEYAGARKSVALVRKYCA
jgi:sugar phosphate isomerase/epimerase